MLTAVVQEEACVGCDKCRAVCPVDAIVGSPQFLYSVLTEECIGCHLCVAPCPMDCIKMVEIPESAPKTIRAERAKTRYLARQHRLRRKELPPLLSNASGDNDMYKVKIQQEIKAAVERVKAKKNAQKNEN